MYLSDIKNKNFKRGGEMKTWNESGMGLVIAFLILFGMISFGQQFL